MTKQRHSISLKPIYWNEKLFSVQKQLKTSSKSKTIEKMIDSFMKYA